ncbi:MAG TPA: FG-GAP repeat protein [Planctomycetota bacterium]|nr:FG-GAP repeat protein [Planctomycetota bacterium]
MVSQEAHLVPAYGTGLTFGFGFSVDVGTDRVVVGYPDQTAPLGGAKGAAYVFDRIGGSWVQQAELGDSSYTGDGRFGLSIALDGDVIAVGTPYVYVPTGLGAVHVFGRVSGTWVQGAVIEPPSILPPCAAAGRSIDIAGDTLLIGATPVINPTPLVHGRALIYERGAGGWNLQWVSPIHSSDGNDAAFGASVLLAGDTAFVGSPTAHGNESFAGAVYVYTRLGGVWSFQQKLTAQDGRFGDRFGFSMAGEADTLLIGATYAEGRIWPNSGAVYVFKRQGNTWLEDSKLVPHSHVQLAKTGISVAQSGKLYLAGSDAWSSFHLFSSSGGSFLEHLQIRPPYVGLPSDRFGECLAMSGDLLAVGARWTENAIGMQTGAVYLYRVDASALTPNFYCAPKSAPPACVPRLYHLGEPSLSGALGGHTYRLRADKVPPKVLGLLAYGTTGAASLPFLGGTLCIAPPIARMAPMSSNGLEPCSGVFDLDFNAWIATGNDPALQPGQQVWFQYWYRDPSMPPPDQIGLTAGVTAVICQ